MPNVDLTEMDLAVITCLHEFRSSDGSGALPPNLTPCLQEQFPGYDEVAMREGESITRLRGRGLIDVNSEGRLRLTALGIQMAEGLELE